jgi:hypothetical protein
MVSLCPLSAPSNLFCIDTLRFSGSLTSITFATYCWVCPPFSGRVMTYLFICLQSFCPLSAPTNFSCAALRSLTPSKLVLIIINTENCAVTYRDDGFTTNSPVHLDCSENCALTRLNDGDRSPRIVEYVLFWGGAMVYLFICLQSFCPLSVPPDLFCIDTWRFLGLLFHKSRLLLFSWAL